MSTIDANSDPTLAELVARAKLFMHLEDDDTALQSDAIALYCSATDATAATVQVTDTQVILIITGGANAGTTTLTLSDAANDTLSELASVIDGTAGWTAELVGKSDADSDTLIRLAATGCLGQANEVTLKHVNEALLELLIRTIWKGIETSLCRDILTTTYSEVYHINGDRTIVLDQPDVTQVTMVALETENGLTVKYDGSDTHARVEVTETAVVLTSLADTASPTTNTILFTDQVTTAAMATAVSAVSGWTGTVVNSRPSGYLVRHGVRDAKDKTITLETWDDTNQEYIVEYDEGLLTLAQHPWQTWLGPARNQAFVIYIAGFATMPADVELALLEAVQAAFNAGLTDLTLQSERIGDYSYTRASILERIAIDAASTAAMKLNKYRRWRP